MSLRRSYLIVAVAPSSAHAARTQVVPAASGAATTTASDLRAPARGRRSRRAGARVPPAQLPGGDEEPAVRRLRVLFLRRLCVQRAASTRPRQPDAISTPGPHREGRTAPPASLAGRSRSRAIAAWPRTAQSRALTTAQLPSAAPTAKRSPTTASAVPPAAAVDTQAASSTTRPPSRPSRATRSAPSRRRARRARRRPRGRPRPRRGSTA